MLRKETFYFRLALSVALALTFALSMTDSPALNNWSVNDKIMHATGFLLLTWLCDFSFGHLTQRLWKSIAMLSFGLLIEFSQSFTRTRYPELLDAVADLAGISVYWLLAPLAGKLAFWRRWLHF